MSRRPPKPTKTSTTTEHSLNQQEAATDNSAASLSHATLGRKQLGEIAFDDPIQMQPNDARNATSSLWLTNNPVQEGSEMLLVRLLDIRENEDEGTSPKGANKVMYFGNDSIWSYSLQKARRKGSVHSASPQSIREQSDDCNIHYTIPETLGIQPRDLTEADDLIMKQEQLKLLQARGAFTLPPFEVQKELLESYFKWLYPLQPILDKQQFLSDFQAGKASALLLQSLLSVATTCCDESTIQKHWKTRRSAQKLFHKRARALYDADYEQNRVTIVQALFLMTFWWGNPTDVKDFSHWLSTSIHTAQMMGMHRSYRYPSITFIIMLIFNQDQTFLFVNA